MSDVRADDDLSQGSIYVGDQLDWDSDLITVHLVVELPFYMMMDTAIVKVASESAEHVMLITDDDVEVFAGEFRDSRDICGYQGSDPEAFETRPDVQALGLPLIRRKQRTTVYFNARCHDAILRSAHNMDPHAGVVRTLSNSYLSTLCEAHIPILNEIIRRYRLLTYDYFAFEVSSWDVPIWHVRGGPTGHVSVQLFDYVKLGGRPRIFPNLLMRGMSDEERQMNHFLTLTDGAALESANSIGVPGEDDLLDARNLMERGDYGGAVRRTTTAIEALVEHVLKLELLKRYGSAEVEAKLEASKTDFPGRLRQWKKLSGVGLPGSLERCLDETRSVRHQIVHEGRRIAFSERGIAQKCVDTGRWIFNHIERDDARRELREKNNVPRAMPRPTLALRFPVEETAEGIVVKSFRDEAGTLA